MITISHTDKKQNLMIERYHMFNFIKYIFDSDYHENNYISTDARVNEVVFQYCFQMSSFF